MLHNALHNIVQYYSHCSYRSIVPLCRHSQKTHNRHWTHTHTQTGTEGQPETHTGRADRQETHTARGDRQETHTGRADRQETQRETDQPKRDTQGHTRHTKMDFKPNPKYIQKF